MQGDSRSMDSTTGALVHSVYDQFTEQHRLCVSYWKQLMHCCSEINPPPPRIHNPLLPLSPIRYSIGTTQNNRAGAYK